MTEIAIPESLQFYFKSLENARSIDRLVESRSSKASEIVDMGWDDLRQFYQAQLAAFKTQVDYWIFCDEVWAFVWGDLIASLPGCTERNGEDYDGERNLEFAWESSLYRMHTWRDGTLITYIACSDESMWTSFHYESSQGDYEASNRLLLSDNWGAVEDDQWNLKNPIKLRSQSVLDLTFLKDEASAALQALRLELK